MGPEIPKFMGGGKGVSVGNFFFKNAVDLDDLHTLCSTIVNMIILNHENIFLQNS